MLRVCSNAALVNMARSKSGIDAAAADASPSAAAAGGKSRSKRAAASPVDATTFRAAVAALRDYGVQNERMMRKLSSLEQKRAARKSRTMTERSTAGLMKAIEKNSRMSQASKDKAFASLRKRYDSQQCSSSAAKKQ